MSANKLKKPVFWLPHAFALSFTILLALIFCQWSGRAVWRAFRDYKEGPIQLAQLPSGAIVWKQPVLPAQYEQASCGACHREDLAQTPRLNHGRQLIARYNCVACHQMQDIDRPAMLGPDLTSVGTKVSREWIYKWLKDPRTLTDADGNVTVDGVETNPRMPKFQLSDEEMRALSAYLSAQRAKPVEPYRFSPRLVAAAARGGDAADQGKIRFNQMFCVTCHALAVDRGGETSLIGGDIGPELTKVGSKVNPDWLAAWLRNPQGYLQHTRMPQYQWSDQDMYEVTQYILKRLTDPDFLKDVPQLGPPAQAEVRLGQSLFVEKGCAECHAIQGVAPESDFGPNLSAFGMSALPFQVEIRMPRKEPTAFHFDGNVSQLDIMVSRIPRFLISYIQAKVINPASVSYGTRMPRFSLDKADLDDVTTALLSMTGPPIAAGAQKSLIVPRPYPEFHPDGQFLELYQRYRCDTCHAFNGYGGTLAPDLSYEGSRARRDWLAQFLKNPQTLRPTLTVRMPEFNMPDKDAAIIAAYLSAALRNPQVNPAATDEKAFAPEMAASGKQLYETKYQCQSCHTIGATGGYVGPSLNNAGNWLTPAWIEAWLRNPQALVPGTIEPRHSFTEDEIKDLTAYLLTLKQAPASPATVGAATGGGQ